MILAVLILVLLCACVVWWLRPRSSAHALPPAFPGELPIIGHLHYLMTDTIKLPELLKSIAKDSLKQGGVTCCKLDKIVYMITDPEDALTVANTCLRKHFLYSFAQNWLGQGLITSTESIWQEHRKLLSPAFTAPVIHSFLNVFNDHARELVKALDPHVGKAEINTSPYMKHFTLAIACMTTFGMKDLKENSFFTKYIEAIDGMLCILLKRFQKVWLHYEFIYKILGWRKKEDQLVKTLNELSDTVIQKYKATAMNGTTKETSFKPMIDQMLQITGEKTFTDLEIREELNTAVLAGFDTTQNSLVFTLALLGSHPEVQEKMYQEIIQVVGADADVDKHDLKKLVYTDAVLKESSRVLPTAPLIARYIDKHVKLKNYTLRAHSDCFILMLGMHLHSSWGPDAEQFKPERWLDPASLPKHPNTFAAFSLGKRSCIGLMISNARLYTLVSRPVSTSVYSRYLLQGKTYAMTSMKVALVHLVRKYRWTADYTKLQCKLDILMQPVKGHEITLQRRVEDK